MDTRIIRTESRFKFKVHRKPTNKEDYIHFYSGHNERVKSGIVIGFFLRAFRICDPEFLDNEIEHIYDAFSKLKYPKGFLIEQKEKAKRIRNKNKKQQEKAQSSKRRQQTWISIPNSKNANIISKTLEKSGVKVATNSGTKIKKIVEQKMPKTPDPDLPPKSVIYEIPCGGCDQSYVGETGRGVETRLKEHKSDVKFHRTSNAIVLHIEKYSHLPDWKSTRILEKNLKKQTRKILEAAHISSRDTFNSSNGFIALASGAVSLVVG